MVGDSNYCNVIFEQPGSKDTALLMDGALLGGKNIVVRKPEHPLIENEPTKTAAPSVVSQYLASGVLGLQKSTHFI